MLHGTSLKVVVGGSEHQALVGAEPVGARPVDRLLSTAEANAFLRRAKGFLEKRRSSGIDSPPYIQRTKRGAVLYRVSDLLAWEEERILTSSSDHDDVAHTSGGGRLR